MSTNHKAIHWPDHVIGKRESRRIREAHNALYNSHDELLAALYNLTTLLNAERRGYIATELRDIALNRHLETATQAIARAKGEA